MYVHTYVCMYVRMHTYIRMYRHRIHAYIHMRADEAIHSQGQMYQRYMRAGAKV